MQEESKLFRKASLDRLSSPEQLDMMTTVTTPYGWLALATFGLIIFMAIVWGFMGSIPIKVKGDGIVMRHGGVSRVLSFGSGQVSEIFVSVNDYISRDQVVARVSDPIRFTELQNLRSRLNEKQAYNAQLTLNLNNRVAFLTKRLADQEALMRKGLITPSKVEVTRGEINEASLSIKSSLSELNALKREVEIKEEKLNMDSRIVSTIAGRIVEINVSPGTIIREGTTILSVENPEAKLEAIVYVPIAEGKKVRPGMEIDVIPASVKKEETGSLLGLVTSVSSYPVTYEGMVNVLGNEELAKMFAKGTPYAVQVDFIPDIRKEGEYRWSTGNISSSQIKSGTLCVGEITVGKKRPISFIIPFIKSAVGF
jgi:HlyD family secretion protein